jgi:hypothetical protein
MVGEAAGSENRDWRARDWLAAAALFAATASVVLWQNAHVAMLYDIGYVLDSAARMAAGQMPYRDFPFAHAPLTFAVQAAIIRLTGRVFFHQVIYVALVGGASTVLAWRLTLDTLRERVKAAWTVALLLAAPLSVLGIYCILPNPEYDCDCAFWILIAVWALRRVNADRGVAGSRGARADVFALATGAALVVPLFFKQNMGLPFLAAAGGAVLLVPASRWLQRGAAPKKTSGSRALILVLAGAAGSLVIALLVLHWTAGIGNYLHWTIGFAAQRRLPGSDAILGVYRDSSLKWTLPSVAAGLILLRLGRGRTHWMQIPALALLAAPFLFTLASLAMYDDADDRATILLALWPLFLLLALALALGSLWVRRRDLDPRVLLPLVLLAAIHGAFLSQQVWGSTYAIWPLLALLLAEVLGFLDGVAARAGTRPWFVPALAAVISAALLVCGGFYTVSEERLSYANLPEGPVQRSAFPELAGMATPGPYLPEFDELLRYAQANIPFDDGVMLIPGEEPFYFATGRVPRFPITIFDVTADPYSPEEIGALAAARDIRWLIVKRDLQIKENPMLEPAETISVLMREFAPVAHLKGYDVYRRKAAE